MDINLDKKYRLRNGVLARQEHFGALLYDADTEALYVVWPAASMTLLRRLDGTLTLRDTVRSVYASEASEAPSVTMVSQLLEWRVIDEI